MQLTVTAIVIGQALIVFKLVLNSNPVYAFSALTLLIG